MSAIKIRISIIATIIIAIAGIGIVAIPAGIIAGGFSELMRKKNK